VLKASRDDVTLNLEELDGFRHIVLHGGIERPIILANAEERAMPGESLIYHRVNVGGPASNVTMVEFHGWTY